MHWRGASSERHGGLRCGGGYIVFLRAGCEVGGRGNTMVVCSGDVWDVGAELGRVGIDGFSKQRLRCCWLTH